MKQGFHTASASSERHPPTGSFAAGADVRAVYCCGPHCASKRPFVSPQCADRVPRSRSSACESASDFRLSVDNLIPPTGRVTAWQSASTKGTQATAKRRFDGQARLAAGMLPVAAAATHERSARAVRIWAVLAAEDSIGPCESLFWSDAEKQLNVGIKFRQSQDYVVSQKTVDEFPSCPTHSTAHNALAVVQAETCTGGTRRTGDNHGNFAQERATCPQGGTVQRTEGSDHQAVASAPRSGF